MNVKLLLLVLPTLVLNLAGLAQNYTMLQPVITGCAGVLHDTGAEAAGYGPNENLISSIFSGIPGATIYLRLTDASFGTGDTLWLYDGGNVLSPLIATITAPAGNWIGRSFFPLNANGAVTARFKSNADSSTGNFHLTFTCNTCQGIRPDMGMADVVRICQGQSVFLDAGASVIPEGSAISAFTWQSGDGNTSASSQFAPVYNVPGVYYASLQIQLSNGCTTPIPAYQRIEVSAQPEFLLTASADSICIGQEVSFDMNIASFSISNALSGPGGYIPDSPAPAIESVITYADADGSVIDSPDDIGHVTLNIEHSFLADLFITLECPNGQSMVLYAGVNGGGIWLGVPIDQVNDLVGTGYLYTFDPNISNPSLGMGGAEYILPVTNTQGGTGNTVLPGSYAADGDWADLVGCPVEGTWTLSIVDQAGADDGTLFNWELALNAISTSGLDQGFVTGNAPNCATLEWTGPGTVQMDEECTTGNLLAENSGWQLYEVIGTSLYGCPISAELFVYVENPLDGYVTTTDALGGNPGTAELHVSEDGGPYTIEWSTGTLGSFTEAGLGGGQHWVQVSNAMGCSETYTFLIETDQNMVESQVENISLWYDAIHKQFHWQSSPQQVVDLLLLDAQGRRVKNWNTRSQAVGWIDLSQLSTGVYFVQPMPGKAFRIMVD